MILDKLLLAIDAGFWRMGQWFGLSAARYCDLETVDDGHALVTRDGGLVSVMELAGTGRMVGSREFDEVVVRVSNQLRAYFLRTGHRLQVVFSRDTDPDAVERQLVEMIGPSVETTRRLQLDLDDLIDEQAATLSRYCAVERIYLVAWTTPAALSPVERGIANGERLEVRRKQANAPGAQRAGNALGALREAHNALIGALTDDFGDVGYRIEALRAVDALRAIRSEIDPHWTAHDWQPSFPGDGVDMPRRARAAERGTSQEDLSEILWPTMERQLIPRGLTLINGRVVRIGQRLYLPMTIAMPPANLQPFDRLFERLRDTDVSYRISWRLSGAGVDDTEIRMRSIMALLSTSKTAKAAHAQAREEASLGAVRVGMQIDVVVWADADAENANDRLLRDGARVARALQGWGGCEVDERLGDPVAPVMGTIPGLLPHGYGTLSVPPIEDAVALLPIARPASPWRYGSFLFRTPDGKLYPYQPYSSEQAAWVTLIYAPMRGGKSVLAAAINTALAMRGGLERLPFIAVLDIGPSSSGMISLLREALPQSMKHQVLYHRLRMDSREAINPCDTMLGMRAPLPAHRAFLVNLLSLLATPVGEAAAPSDVPLLAGAAVDASYVAYSDGGSKVRRYARINGEIDALIDQYGIHWDDHSTWWEIVDELFRVGEHHGAMLAQRFAVPKLGEIASEVRDHKIATQFTGRAPNGQPVVEAFFNAVTHSVREYPILATETKFSLGDARIVSLDLADVAPKGGPTADRQTCVMYMIARQVLTARFFVHADDLASARMPDAYRGYHYREIQLIADDPKRVFYDEFHRTNSTPIVRQQVMTDIREGAKANLEIILASQRLEDFDEDMVDLATTIFVVGVGQLSLAETVRTFQLGPHAAVALERIGKPTAAGARLLGVFSTRSGRYVAELMHTLSPTALWAYGTTSEDRSIRDRLYRVIGPTEARRLLARIFPSGSAKDEVERRRQDMGARGGTANSAEEADASLIERMVSELVIEYENGLKVA